MDDIFFVLECTAAAWFDLGTVELFANGIPVARLNAKSPDKFSGSVNEFLLSGPNVFSMAIELIPGITPDAVKKRVVDQKTAHAEWKLSKYPTGAIEGGPDGVQLGAGKWVPAALEGEPEPFPQIFLGTVDLGPRPGRPWKWEAAPPIELNPATVAEILKFLAPIHAGLQQGDSEPFLAATKIRLADLETAYASFSADDRASLIRRVTKKQSKEAWWGMQPLDPANFAPRLCAANRMVECRALDLQPFLREKADATGNIGFYEMFLAKLDGAWQVVR
jgi:hypothetical protein